LSTLLTCCVRSTPRPPRTGTSAAASPTSPGSAPTAPTSSATRPASDRGHGRRLVLTSVPVLVGRNRGQRAEESGGERAAPGRARRGGHLAGPPRPPLRFPRPRQPG